MVRWLLATSILAFATAAQAYVIDADTRTEDDQVLQTRLLGRWLIQENTSSRELHFDQKNISQIWSQPRMSAREWEAYKLKGRQIITGQGVVFTVVDLTSQKLVTVDRSGAKSEWQRLRR